MLPRGRVEVEVVVFGVVWHDSDAAEGLEDLDEDGDVRVLELDLVLRRDEFRDGLDRDVLGEGVGVAAFEGHAPREGRRTP